MDATGAAVAELVHAVEGDLAAAVATLDAASSNAGSMRTFVV